MRWTPMPSQASGLAVGSFVFGLTSIALAIFPFGMFLGPIAIILGLLARRRPRIVSVWRLLARVGILFGAVGTIIWLAGFVLLALFAS